MRNIPRPEYPRPQFVRREWMNLNGIWDFDFDDANKGVEEKWFISRDFTGKINVPFPFQSMLSGIGENGFHDIVWYRRHFGSPENWHGKRMILHFGAVDYRAWVWINGALVAYHEGGHTPFHADITPYLKKEGNQLVVRVEDPSTALDIPRGKQYWKEKPESIFYTRTTGIWQTVWLEAVSPTYLEKVRLTPNIDTDEITLEYTVNQGSPEKQLEIEISFNGQFVAKETVQLLHNQASHRIMLHDFHVHDPGRLWSPEHPNLYDVILRIKEKDRLFDEVKSYFGMRKISIENGKVMLNNRPYYMKLVLDQGYFSEGVYTAPTDDHLKRDIELAKTMGFNGARKHQKVEDPRYHYWADRLGFLVWGEIANCHMYSDDAVRRISSEWQEAIHRDYNHPCIVVWVPINESWGVPGLLTDPRQRAHLLSLYNLTKSLDPTRLVIDNDGWEHTITDLFTIHDYESSKEVLKERYRFISNILSFMPGGRLLHIPGFGYRGEPILVTEFGGIAYQRDVAEGWGYSVATSETDFAERYYKVVSALLESPLIQGFCYTQLYDIEQEINGLLTYDRKPKIDLKTIRSINEGKKLGDV